MLIYIVFLEKLRSLSLYLTYKLVQILIAFNRTDVSFLDKLVIKYRKLIFLIFHILGSFFVSNAMNFLIHSVTSFFLINAYALLVFFNQVLSMQICPWNACKLEWEENLFDLYVELIAFRIKKLIKFVTFLTMLLICKCRILASYKIFL